MREGAGGMAEDDEWEDLEAGIEGDSRGACGRWGGAEGRVVMISFYADGYMIHTSCSWGLFRRGISFPRLSTTP